MNRRAALKELTLVVGGGLSAPTLAGLLGGCRPGPTTESYASRALSGEAYEKMALLSDLIIPPTETVGARAAGVPEFVDRMLDEWYPESDRQRFVDGLRTFDQRCVDAYGSNLLDCSDEERALLTEALDEETFGEETDRSDLSHFFRVLKELTIVGYYTSFIGATTELHMNPMGVFRADVPFEEIEKAWA